MKIKLLRDAAIDASTNGKQGQVLELPDHHAKQLIWAGAAEQTDQAITKPKGK